MKTAIHDMPAISDDSFLSSLTDSQLDHVSVGLEHSFGIQMSGTADTPEKIGLLLPNGKLVPLRAAVVTVADVWEMAKGLT